MPMITKGDLSLAGLMGETESAAAREMSISLAGAKKGFAAAEEARKLAEKEALTTADADAAASGATEAMDIALLAMKQGLKNNFDIDALLAGKNPKTVLGAFGDK